MTNKKANKGTRLVLIFMIIVILPTLWFVFLKKDSDQETASKVLTGKWLRIDGSYTLEFSQVEEKGKVISKYFNPDPINVGRSEWRIKDDRLEVFVELQDVNYPGSTYTLIYYEKTLELRGTYYQAVARQNYAVTFKQVKGD